MTNFNKVGIFISFAKFYFGGTGFLHQYEQNHTTDELAT